MATSDYCSYYTSQLGGQQFRVFRGGLQSGAGLGDILRGLFRFLAPVALRGLSAFAGNTLSAHQAGMPLSAAAKSALGPAISAAAGSAAPTVTRFMNSVMPSLLRGEPKVTQQPDAGDESKQQQRGSGVLFDGIDGIPITDGAIRQYIRGAPHTLERIGKRAASNTKQHKEDGKLVCYNF